MALEDLKSFLYKDASAKKESLEDKASNLSIQKPVQRQKIDPNRPSMLQDGAIIKSQSVDTKKSLLKKEGPVAKTSINLDRKGSFYKPFNLGVSGVFSTYPSVSGGSSNIISDSKTASVAGGSLSVVTPPNSDSNTVLAPAIYELQVGLKINEVSSNIINIVYSQDNGTTWKSFRSYYELQYNAPVGGVSMIGTRGQITVNQGSDVWIAIEDYYTEAGIVFGAGLYSGEFSSLCGRTNPLKLTNISTLGKVFVAYVNVNVQGGELTVCGPDDDDYYYGDDSVNGYNVQGYFGES